MRSSQEIAFRIGQQIANAKMLVFPPRCEAAGYFGTLPLPSPSTSVPLVRGTPFEAHVKQLADQMMAHRFPIFGTSLNTGPDVDWRRDYRHAKSSEAAWFRLVPYLDFEKVGDHKFVWELNRHQHLIVLAQAWLLTGDRKYLAEVESQLASWWDQNPFAMGINWTSALEVAFRALSWLWVDHLAGEALGSSVRARLRLSLHQHGAHLRHNLSTYFSPNTHLLGEAVALHALGLKFKHPSWTSLGARIVSEELVRQVRPDGSHFEQSTYYHVYALDFFLLHYILAGRPENLRPPIQRMAHYLSVVMGPSRTLTVFGDDDGGRLFHPYGDRSLFGRVTLATAACLFPDVSPSSPADGSEQAAWWVGLAPPERAFAPASELFPDAGLASLVRGSNQLLLDAGPFGPGGAGHSHSDTLSLTLRVGAREILIDPGTYTYVSNPEWRNRFRGSRAHSTVLVDGLDQAAPVNAFRWEGKPAVMVRQWLSRDGSDYLDAECRYHGVSHRRRAFWGAAGVLFLIDQVAMPSGTHQVEQLWHFAEPIEPRGSNNFRSACVSVVLANDGTAEVVAGWRSRVFGEKEPVEVLRVWHTAEASLTWGAAFLLDAKGSGPSGLQLKEDGTDLWATLSGEFQSETRFPEAGMPVVTRT